MADEAVAATISRLQRTLNELKSQLRIDVCVPGPTPVPEPAHVLAMVSMYASELRHLEPVGAAAIDEAVKHVKRLLEQADTAGVT